MDSIKDPFSKVNNYYLNTVSITASILDWFVKSKRDLPFRNTKDPYLVWLSEVMLQQTQVKTAIPYYKKWIKKYPSIRSVAHAKESELLKCWEGLGYYARCRNFHKSARIIVKYYDGFVPNNWDKFRSFPGVGDYTAAAVLSIAFKQPFPAIDGNVRRVMARILGYRKLSKRNMNIIQSTLCKWIHTTEPGDFNQAMMDLGACVCFPTNPACMHCPVNYYCKAFSSGNPMNYPLKNKHKKIPDHTFVAGIIWQGDQFFIQKRYSSGMLGGLWEFPGGKVESGESLVVALKQKIKEKCGTETKIIKQVGSINHAYSHFSITLYLYHCKTNGELLKPKQRHQWITPGEIKKYAFPKANHKLFAILNNDGWCI